MDVRATGTDLTSASAGLGSSARKSLRWLSWIFGVALLAAVVAGVLHFAEARELARTAEHAQPWWLALAVLLQIGTYVGVGQVFRRVVRARGHSLSLAAACRLSLM